MPIPFEPWLAFVAATVVLVAVPGPTALVVVSHGITHGRRGVLPSTIGVVLGDLTAMTVALIGLGAVLTASAIAFSVLKWIGVFYLTYLGVRMWRAGPVCMAADDAVAAGGSSVTLARHAYLVTALNPKSIVFFIAFLPQFVVGELPTVPQLLILGATFLVLGGINAAAYGMLANQARDIIQRREWQMRSQKVGGLALIAAGAYMATLRQPS